MWRYAVSLSITKKHYPVITPFNYLLNFNKDSKGFQELKGPLARTSLLTREGIFLYPIYRTGAVPKGSPCFVLF